MIHFERKKYFRIPTSAVLEIIHAAAPRLDAKSKTCLDCGGLYMPSSPVHVIHRDGCIGLIRARRIENALSSK